MSLLSGRYKTLLIGLNLSVLVLTIVGCGYRFQDTREPIGIQFKSMAIPLMESTSSSAGFEGDFTRIIREEFASHTKIPLLPKDEATVVLIGRVSEIKTEPLSYNLEQTVFQGQVITHELTRTRRLKIKLDAKLLDRATRKVIWEDKGMEEKASFAVGTDPLANRYNERKAVKEMARRFAKRLYLKTLERF